MLGRCTYLGTSLPNTPLTSPPYYELRITVADQSPDYSIRMLFLSGTDRQLGHHFLFTQNIPLHLHQLTTITYNNHLSTSASQLTENGRQQVTRQDRSHFRRRDQEDGPSLGEYSPNGLRRQQDGECRHVRFELHFAVETDQTFAHPLQGNAEAVGEESR